MPYPKRRKSGEEVCWVDAPGASGFFDNRIGMPTMKGGQSMKRCGNIFAFTYAHPKKLQNRLRNHAVSLSEKRGCETNKDLIEKGLRPHSSCHTSFCRLQTNKDLIEKGLRHRPPRDWPQRDRQTNKDLIEKGLRPERLAPERSAPETNKDLIEKGLRLLLSKIQPLP